MTEEFEATFADVLDGVPEAHMDHEQFVPGHGPFDAAVVLVGEAPGAREVEQGLPFVGPAGRRLDSVLDSLDVDREGLYVTNLVKVRPPENRDPTSAEIDAWRPVLDAELHRIDPAVVVTLGAVASRELLGDDRSLGEMRGDPVERDGFAVVPTYHPAATLYDESTRPKLAADLEMAFDLASES